jgi:hypothetical protein
MTSLLHKLIFGLNEYEKVRIDDRFKQITEIIDTVKLDKLDDFEELEECLFKIKEQLRVRSSNLNKTISDPNSSLRKKVVLEIIDRLEKIKYEFLKNAFSKIDTREINSKVENNSNNNNNNAENEDITSKIKTNEDNKTKSNDTIKDSILITQNEQFKLFINNGKTQYFLVKFEEEVNYTLLSSFASLIFDICKAQGTNIIIEGKTAIIAVRFEGDSLLNLERIESDIDEIYSKLTNKNENISTKDKSTEEDNQYREILEPANNIKTHKQEEDSLDSLLSGIDDKDTKKIIDSKEYRNDESKIEIEKSDKIEIEKKDTTTNPEIEIVREDTKEAPTEKQDITKVEADQVIEKKLPNIEPLDYEVYKDDNIIAYFEKNSIAKGELIVKSFSDKNMNDLDESELSYMTIFSKVFASILFEIGQLQGTNIIWDYNSK